MIHISDWDSWDIGKGTNDLAYLIGLHWYPDLRQRREQLLLMCYPQTFGTWCFKLLMGRLLARLLRVLKYEFIHPNLAVAAWDIAYRVVVVFGKKFLTFDDLKLIELL